MHILYFNGVFYFILLSGDIDMKLGILRQTMWKYHVIVDMLTSK